MPAFVSLRHLDSFELNNSCVWYCSVGTSGFDKGNFIKKNRRNLLF